MWAISVTQKDIDAAASAGGLWLAFVPDEKHLNIYGTLIGEVSFRPIEVMQPLLSNDGEAVFDTSGDLIYRSVNEIRLTRWMKAFSEDQQSTFLGLEDDADSVRFKIPGFKDGPQLKISTKEITGSASGRTKDGPCTMGASRKDALTDVWMSFPFNLVADDDDDKTYNRDGTDDGNDDGTYLASLGAKVTLEITLPNSGKTTVDFPVAKRTATVRLKMYHLSIDGVVDTSVSQRMRDDVASANRIYAPWGIQFEIASIDGIPLAEQAAGVLDDGILDDAIFDQGHYRKQQDQNAQNTTAWLPRCQQLVGQQKFLFIIQMPKSESHRQRLGIYGSNTLPEV